jgi:hypothetical protein
MLLPVQDLKKKDGGAWGLDFLDLRKSSLEGDAIKVVYLKGSNSTDEQMENGGIEIVAVPKGVLPSKKTITFAVDIFYPKDFDFTRGGKTGVGLAMGKDKASGGVRSSNSSTARICWRDNGKASLYVYCPKDLDQVVPELDKTKHEGWGTEFFLDTFKSGTLKRGAWNTLSVAVKLNTFSDGHPNADGSATATINGKSRTLEHVRWLKNPEYIHSILGETFFGGESWEASKTEIVYFKNYMITAS